MEGSEEASELSVQRSERSTGTGTRTGSASDIIELDSSPVKSVLSFDHMWYHALKADQKAGLLADAHRATSMLFFKHNIPFSIINTREFRDMIQAAQKCPVYKPVDRRALSGPQLEARSAEADVFKEKVLLGNAVYGFTITGDGFASLSKRHYNNIIIVAGGMPVFLGLVDRTGLGATGVDVAEEFEEVINELEEHVSRNLIFGVTDTPSANRKAWRLLMGKFPRMYWGGCMSHEISLYMGDIAKMECSTRLADKCHKLYKWIMLHAVGDVSLLSLFQEKVNAHFLAKFNAASDPKVRRACKSRMKMLLYKKGDTRMLSIFKLLFRTLYLMEPLVAVFSDARYAPMAQKAIKQYNAQASHEKKIKKRTGMGQFVDSMFDTFGGADRPIWDEIETWLQANLAIVYFHRIVDTHEPALHLVYYCSALNDKHLRVLADLDSEATWLHNMLANYEKRWARWHLHIHTAAYHFAPQYQSHMPSREEWRECANAIERLWPDEADEILTSLKQFKQNPAVLGVSEEDLKKAETGMAHLWYHMRDHSLPPAFAKAGMQLCAQPASASVAEQGVCGWSKVGCIETSKRTRLMTAKTNMLVNVSGWLWAQEKMKEVRKRPHNLQLYDTMDDLMERTQDAAREAGKDEGVSDAHTEFEFTDGEDEEGGAVELEIPDITDVEMPPSTAIEKEGAYDGLAGGESDYGSSDDEAARSSPLPPATVVKYNDKLKEVLTCNFGKPGCNLRNTDFESTARKLAFS